MVLRDEMVAEKAALTQEIRELSFDIYGLHLTDAVVREKRKRLDQAKRELIETCDIIRQIDRDDTAKG